MTETVGIARQIACVKREIALRERVYPKWIAAGRLSQKIADNELSAMRAVLATLERTKSVDDRVDATYREITNR